MTPFFGQRTPGVGSKATHFFLWQRHTGGRRGRTRAQTWSQEIWEKPSGIHLFENDGERCQMRQPKMKITTREWRCIIFPLRLKQIDQRKNRSVSKPISKPQPFPQHEKAKLQTFIRLYQDGKKTPKVESGWRLDQWAIKKRRDPWPKFFGSPPLPRGGLPTDTELKLTPWNSPTFYQSCPLHLLLPKKMGKKSSTGVTLPQQVSETLYL